MKLTISDGDTSWEVEALDDDDPDFAHKYSREMILFGHVYVFHRSTNNTPNPEPT